MYMKHTPDIAFSIPSAVRNIKTEVTAVGTCTVLVLTLLGGLESAAARAGIDDLHLLGRVFNALNPFS